MGTERPGSIPTEALKRSSPEQYQSPEERGEPKVTFLYIEHAPQNALRVAKRPEVAGADLILLETIGGSKSFRSEVETFYNNVLKKEFLQNPKKEHVQEKLSSSGDFQMIFVGELSGSGKSLKLIDVPQEHPSAQTHTEFQLNVELSVPLLLRKGRIEEAYQRYLHTADLLVSALRERERYVHEELEKIIPETAKNVVVIVQGAAHTRTHHRFKKSFPEAKVGFAIEPSPMYFSSITALARKKLFSPQEKIPDVEYRRGFLADELFPYGFSKLKSEREVEKISLALARRLSSEEVEQVFQDLSSAYAGFQEKYQDPRRAFAQTALTLTHAWLDKKAVKSPERFGLPFALKFKR